MVIVRGEGGSSSTGRALSLEEGKRKKARRQEGQREEEGRNSAYLI